MHRRVSGKSDIMLKVRRVFFGWWMVAGLCLTEPIAWGILIYSFSVFVVPMRAELGWTPAELNGAYTLGVLVSAVVAIPLGRVLQRHGARWVMTCGSALTVVVLLLWAWTQSLVLFYFTFMLAGICMAATLYEPAFAVTAAWFRRFRARAVLVVTIAGGLGSTIFVPITGALISAQGWRTALVTLAVVVLVIAVPVHAGLLRRRPSDLGLKPDGGTDTTIKAHRDVPAVNPRQMRRRVARSHSFRWITLSLVVHEAAKFAVFVVLVSSLTDRGYSLGAASIMAGSIGAFQVIGRVISVWLHPRVPLHRTAFVLFTVQGLALPIPLLTSGTDPLATGTVIVMIILFGIGFGLPDLLRGTVVVDYYGAAVFPSINGIISAFCLAARAVGPLLAGIVVTIVGDAAPVLVGTAVLMLFSAFAFHRGYNILLSERAVDPQH